MDLGAWQQRCSGLERLDRDLIAGHVLGWSRAQVIAHPEHELSHDQLAALDGLLHRAREGEPLAYLTGEKEFYGLMLTVTPDVLIPRPETEHLVETALRLSTNGAEVLDLGTGSGAVAIALADTRTVTAVDASVGALRVAAKNAERHQRRVALSQSDWFSNVSGQFELIVANPPYVADSDPALAALAHEPLAALAAGTDGLDDLRTIIGQAQAFLLEDGHLAVEHGADQGEAVRTLFERAGYRKVCTERDYAGLERVTSGQRAGAVR